jgi:hypothetical protein
MEINPAMHSGPTTRGRREIGNELLTIGKEKDLTIAAARAGQRAPLSRAGGWADDVRTATRPISRRSG